MGTGRGRAQKLEAQLQPRAEFDLAARTRVHGSLRLRGDVFDELEPGSPAPQEVSRISRRGLLGSQADVELRELYLQTARNALYLTIGKQQVVWGKSDGLKVLDVVNPQDFREFILDDFGDSRTPLWTVNAELGLGDLGLQLLWIPDPSGHELPEAGSVFAFTSDQLVPEAPAGVPLELRSPDRPRRLISDSDLGFRLGGFAAGFDFSLNYLYRYDDFPALKRRFSGPPGSPRVVIEPTYERMHLMGGTLGTAVGSLAVRTELAHTVGKWFSTSDLGDGDGLVRANETAFVVGLDWTGFRNVFLSAQLFQSVLSSHPSGLLRDRRQTNFTFLWQWSGLNDTLRARLFWLHGLDEADGLVRYSLAYDVSDHTSVYAGVDFFYGSESGVFGQYSAADRFVMGVDFDF